LERGGLAPLLRQPFLFSLSAKNKMGWREPRQPFLLFQI